MGYPHNCLNVMYAESLDIVSKDLMLHDRTISDKVEKKILSRISSFLASSDSTDV